MNGTRFTQGEVPYKYNYYEYLALKVLNYNF